MAQASTAILSGGTQHDGRSDGRSSFLGGPGLCAGSYAAYRPVHFECRSGYTLEELGSASSAPAGGFSMSRPVTRIDRPDARCTRSRGLCRRTRAMLGVTESPSTRNGLLAARGVAWSRLKVRESVQSADRLKAFRRFELTRRLPYQAAWKVEHLRRLHRLRRFQLSCGSLRMRLVSRTASTHVEKPTSTGDRLAPLRLEIADVASGQPASIRPEARCARSARRVPPKRSNPRLDWDLIGT